MRHYVTTGIAQWRKVPIMLAGLRVH